jgi:hypothetical protein
VNVHQANGNFTKFPKTLALLKKSLLNAKLGKENVPINKNCHEISILAGVFMVTYSKRADEL